MRTTRYFEQQVLRKRPYLERAWCEQTIAEPTYTQIEPGGRVRYWKQIPELGLRWLRVVTLGDGTVHNAFPDRTFRPPR